MDGQLMLGSNVPRKFVAVILACFMTNGCEVVPSSDPIETSDLYGVYFANFDSGLYDELELIIDSTYVRRLLTYDSILYVDSGTWSLAYRVPDSKRDAYITLHDFRKRYPILPDSKNYSSDEDAKVDSLPDDESLNILISSSGELRWIRLGSRYYDAWSREEIIE